MSKVFIQEDTLTNIANAIREKNGTTEPIAPQNMADAIDNIVVGGGNEPIILTGKIANAFTHTPQPVIDAVWPRIRTNDLINADSFISSQTNKIETIPFDINIKADEYSNNDYRLELGAIFSGASYLQTLPKINVKWDNDNINYLYLVSLANLFNGCRTLKEIPYNYLNDIFNNEAYKEKIKNISSTYSKNLFNGCYALRRHPDLSILNIFKKGYYDGIYYQGFYNCYSLDEIIDIPIIKDTSMGNYNAFTSTFYGTCRAKNITFKKVDEPIVWSNQSISFEYSGYCSSSTMEENMLKYNLDMKNKKVSDDATYQALKNDPDWYSSNINYSRYNRISAINTINSLPNTSEQVASTGKPNIIKFKGASGALTDGGAINTLTEEEIAVATAKGWTVSLV